MVIVIIIIIIFYYSNIDNINNNNNYDHYHLPLTLINLIRLTVQEIYLTAALSLNTIYATVRYHSTAALMPMFTLHIVHPLLLFLFSYVSH